LKVRVFDTSLARTLDTKRIDWVENGVPTFKVVLVSRPPMMSDTLIEIEDGVTIANVREAIQAAALAYDWHLASEIAGRYELVVCLRCSVDLPNVTQRGVSKWIHPVLLEREVGLYKKPEIYTVGNVCNPCHLALIEERARR
jgi:hypothetical protein